MLMIVIRTGILYFLVILGIRLMGKRQIGDMQPGELVITILISEIAAIPLQDFDQPILTGAVAIFTLVFLEILISVITMKFNKFRRVFYGDSAIIIKDGKLDQKMLKKLRVTVPDLLEVMRTEQIFDISDVAYAILETNGQLSIMPKSACQTATVGDLEGNIKDAALPYLVISDGRFIDDSIKQLGYNRTTVTELAKLQGLNPKDIFLMTCDKNGKTNIIEKDVEN